MRNNVEPWYSCQYNAYLYWIEAIHKNWASFRSLLWQQCEIWKQKFKVSPYCVGHRISFLLKPLHSLRVRIGNAVFVTPCGDICSTKNIPVIWENRTVTNDYFMYFETMSKICTSVGIVFGTWSLVNSNWLGSTIICTTSAIKRCMHVFHTI